MMFNRDQIDSIEKMIAQRDNENNENPFNGLSKIKDIERSVTEEVIEKIGKRFADARLKNFKEINDSLKQAKTFCENFISNIQETISAGRCLAFFGSTGSGKTHLAAAIFRAARMSGINSEYKLSREITREIKESWGSDVTAESRIIKHYSQIPLLIIDEIGLDYGSETNLHIISEVFDNRYRKMKSTVLIGNIDSKEQFDKFIGMRIDSRLAECGEVIYFDDNDYRKGVKK